MSRIGNAPVPVPTGVAVSVDGTKVVVKGARGRLEQVFSDRISISLADGSVVVTRLDEERATRALHGLTRALIANMVVGVSEGYQKDLQLIGTGYRASLKGKGIELLLGFSHPVQIEAPDGIEFEVPEPTRVTVRGIDKQLVGQIAADLRRVRPPEPYKGKGVRYVDEYVRRKAGKAAGA